MAPGKKSDNPLRIFVRVGALKRFHTLTRDTRDLPVVVSWDRRKGDRRSPVSGDVPDRRATDRRGAPPFTWQVADFVVVEDPNGAAPEPAKASEASRVKERRKK
jgi:hypothetical protein